jgi:hypothetical protein
MNLQQIDHYEWWALGIYYCPSMACCLLLAAVMGFLPFIVKGKLSEAASVSFHIGLAAIPFLGWTWYLVASAHYAFLVTSLDTEDDISAERIYRTYFDLDLDRVVKIAADNSEAGNVRFYASCRIADLIATNRARLRRSILEKTSSASPFKTGFFRTNSLTSGFITPGYQEGPFTVNGIVERRLRLLSRNVDPKTD